jgi:hypothetical protein
VINKITVFILQLKASEMFRGFLLYVLCILELFIKALFTV